PLAVRRARELFRRRSFRLCAGAARAHHTRIPATGGREDRICLGRLRRHHAESRAALRAPRTQRVFPAGLLRPRYGADGDRGQAGGGGNGRHRGALRSVRTDSASRFPRRRGVPPPGPGARDVVVPAQGPAVISATFNLGTWMFALPVLLVAATFTWLLSIPLRNVSIVDSLWSLMLFAAGVMYGLGADPRAPRLAFVLWLLVLWAFRLSFYISKRSIGKGEDHRYQEIRARNEPGFQWKSLYLVFWLQALLAWVISLPLSGAFASIRPLNALDYVGIALWL